MLRATRLGCSLLRMKDQILSSALRITDRRTAAAFSNPLRRRLVLMLAHQERSLAQLAQSTGLDLKRLHYHAIALKKCGLIKVLRTQKRAGRPIKFYRATALAFFVPAELAPSPLHAALDAELHKSIAMLRDPALDGMLYHVGEDGDPRMQAVQRQPRMPAAYVEHWRVLLLTRNDAVRLTKEVETLLKSFAASDSAAGKRYLVHFAFAPSLSISGSR